MMSTDDLQKSVQDANQSQGTVSNTNNQDVPKLTPPQVSLKQRKDSLKQEKSARNSKLSKKLFDDEDKENEASNENQNNNEAAPQRYSRRNAGEDLTEAEALAIKVNANHKKKPTTAPAIKHSHRFEKTPAELAVVVKPYKDESKKNMVISQTELDKKLENLKNFKKEKVAIVPEKVNGVRVCKDENNKQLEKLFTLKLICCKLTFFATSLAEHRKHFGLITFIQSKMDATLKAIKELRKNPPDLKLPQKVSLEKIKENPGYLLAIQPAPENSFKEYPPIPVTWEVIEKWRGIAQHGRKPKQCEVMGISAGEYVQLFGFSDPLDSKGVSSWEWLHIIAHSLGGPDNKAPQLDKNWDGNIKDMKGGPQVCDNLVAGPAGTNTWMMIGEFPPHYLLIDYRDKVEKVFISARADLFPGTHIANKITYTIAWTPKNSSEQKSLTFKFNPLRFDAPPKVLESYLRKVIDAEMAHQHPNEKILDKTTNQNKVAPNPRFIDLDEVSELRSNNNNNNNFVNDVTNNSDTSVLTRTM